MASHTVEGACAFAWRIYSLFHNDTNENDARRTVLHRYLTHLFDEGEDSFEALQVAGLVYLKKFDQLGNDQEARLESDRALEKALKSRPAVSGHPAIDR